MISRNRYHRPSCASGTYPGPFTGCLQTLADSPLFNMPRLLQSSSLPLFPPPLPPCPFAFLLLFLSRKSRSSSCLPRQSAASTSFLPPASPASPARIPKRPSVCFWDTLGAGLRPMQPVPAGNHLNPCRVPAVPEACCLPSCPSHKEC